MLIVLLLLLSFPFVARASVTFNTRDAVVWHPLQTIAGKVSKPEKVEIKLLVNDDAYNIITDSNGCFSVEIMLKDPVNKISAADNDPTPAILILTLGYRPLPMIHPMAEVHHSKLELAYTITDNPYQRKLHSQWFQFHQMKLIPVKSTLTVPVEDGWYEYRLRIISDKDTSWFATGVSVNDKLVKCFDPEKDSPYWMDSAIIYQVTPTAFEKEGGIAAITQRLGELKDLGINTIMLQPVFQTAKGFQGYDVTDFFNMRNDIGTEAQLRQLVDESHALGLRVLLDMIPNHVSLTHAYAQEVTMHARQSHYYDFFQHNISEGLYKKHYHKDSSGFVYYFWKDLVNLNYNNPEVRSWITQACLYWLKKFDIDGYRFDAVWGVNDRCPGFGKALRLALKSVKPSLLMLAEDKGAIPMPYRSGFDMAYDWTDDLAWISQWSWQTRYDAKKSITVFNDTGMFSCARTLRKVLGSAANGPLLRFMENNDLPRFITTHSPEKTKMAASLLFALPGVPMLYNGQETGITSHPYSGKTIYEKGKPMRLNDHDSLFDFYRRLASLRKNYSVLQKGQLSLIPVNDSSTIAYKLQYNGASCLVVMNMDSTAKKLSLNVDQKDSYQDVLNREKFIASGKNVLDLSMPRYSVRWLFNMR